MQIRGELLARSKTFWVTLALFLALNAWTGARYWLFSIGYGRELTIGFPFPFVISGGIAADTNFYTLGAILDVVLALTSALITTWIALALGNRDKT